MSLKSVSHVLPFLIYFFFKANFKVKIPIKTEMQFNVNVYQFLLIV